MRTALEMDEDQLMRFVDLLSDKYREDTWESLSQMVINAGIHALETMSDGKDIRMEKASIHTKYER